MTMRMLVMGSGLQGSACAFDLLNNPDVTEVRLADQRVDNLPPFLAPHVGGRLTPTPLDARDEAAVARVMAGCDAAMSALPYYLNDTMAKLALDAGLHFCDLGGNTDIVMRQRLLDRQARSRGVSIVPDCGLAPGMVNILAQHGIEQLDEVDAVRLYVGGLPQQPTPPLNYQVVYSLEGVLDYYTTKSWVLRDSKLTNVTALSEIEHIDFPAPLGTLEAFHTAGGLSTMAFRYEGRIRTMEYKTLRYPGHATIVEAIRELGFLDLEPVTVKGTTVVPRDVAIAVMDPHLRRPQSESPDMVVLQVTVEGTAKGKTGKAAWQVVDRCDEAHGVTAMMRTTGYSLAITGLMQCRKDVAPGVWTPDECMPAVPYIAELRKRGIEVTDLA
jgi:lysine 6-dehydrogenase